MNRRNLFAALLGGTAALTMGSAATTTTSHTVQRTRTIVGGHLPLAFTGTVGSFKYKLVRAAELVVSDLQPGDLVHVDAWGQASTRDGILRAGHGRFLKATKTGSSAEHEGLMLARPMGHNTTAQEHHSMLGATGAFVADADWSGSVKLILVMYAYWLSASDSYKSLKVDYVEITAAVTRLR